MKILRSGHNEVRVYRNTFANSVEASGAVDRDGGVGAVLQGAVDAATNVAEHVNECTAGGGGGDGELVALTGIALFEACGEVEGLAGVFGSLAVDGDVTGEREFVDGGAHCSRELWFKKETNGTSLIRYPFI